MGTWAPDSFSNDGALDWLYELERHGQTSINKALAAIESLPLTDMPEAPDCEIALAAAEMVAAARGNPPENFPEEASDWLAANELAVTDDLLATARQVVNRILRDSELKELWEEEGNDTLQEWLDHMNDLLTRLS